MFELIRLFFDICLLKKGPQDVPYSTFVLFFTLILYVLVNLLLLHLSSNWLDTVLQVIVEILLLLGFTLITLFVSNKLQRFYQTASALLGSDLVISFIALPALSTLSTGRGQSLPVYVLTALMLWNWLVTGHIFRHALAKPLNFALVISLIYLYCSYRIMAIMFF